MRLLLERGIPSRPLCDCEPLSQVCPRTGMERASPLATRARGGEARGGSGGGSNGGEVDGGDLSDGGRRGSGGALAASLALWRVERCSEPGIPCHSDRRGRERRSRARRHSRRARDLRGVGSPVLSADVQRRTRKQAQRRQRPLHGPAGSSAEGRRARRRGARRRRRRRRERRHRVCLGERSGGGRRSRRRRSRC